MNPRIRKTIILISTIIPAIMIATSGVAKLLAFTPMVICCPVMLLFRRRHRDGHLPWGRFPNPAVLPLALICINMALRDKEWLPLSNRMARH
jgi:hypothetical protein